MTIPRLIGLVPLLALTFPGHAAGASLAWPQLLGPCAGTLQACIDAVDAGDTVIIVADDGPLVPGDGLTVIDEDLVIVKSLTLRARSGIDAVFASQRRILVSAPSGASNVTVSLSEMTFLDGRVEFSHQSTGVATYTAERLRFVQSRIDDAAALCSLEFAQRAGGTAQFRVYENQIEFRAGGRRFCGIDLRGDGGDWVVDVRRNRIRGSAGGTFSRGIQLRGDSTGPVDVLANQILGGDFASGIFIDEQAGTGVHTLAIESNAVVGQRGPGVASVENGISVTPANADVYLNNNTVIRGNDGVRIYPGINGAADSTAGRVASNLIAYNVDRGLSIGPATVANRNNLVFGNGFNAFPAGPGTVTGDPRLRAMLDPRPEASSPARNAGSTADVSTGITPFDADGEVRVIGAVDIGAFEFNADESVVHESTFGNTSGAESFLTTLNNVSEDEKILLTPHHDAVHGVELANTLGVFTPVSFRFSVIHENQTALSTARRFSVLAPADGRVVFDHTTTSGTVNGRFSTLDHPSLNAVPTALAFVLHNYNPGGGGGAFHDQRIGVSFAGGFWSIDNQDLASDMPAGRSFNVAVAPVGSPNAFKAVADASTARLVLQHPLLDDNACAAPIVTRNLTAPGPAASNVAFSVDFVAGTGGAPGHWSILAEGSGTPVFEAGTGFNVMVHGAQANACGLDALFADGFEAAF